MSTTLEAPSHPATRTTIRRSLAAGAALSLLAVLVPPGCMMETGSTETDPAEDEQVATAAGAIAAPPNLALGKPTSQSSNYPHPWAAAGNAADGNTEGNFASVSVTHTNYDYGAWWQVDLQSVESVGNVVVWNRTDCCGDRLSNFNLLVSSDGVSWQSYAHPGAAGQQTSFAVNRAARYVKVQLNGANYLSLAEVQVFPPTPVMGSARCGDKVRVKSWKGDYLHRPDSPQGVTTWSHGDWTLECRSNGSIQLRSWKGDYLHRPDSPQGVTTWAFGEWTVENTSNGRFQLRSWRGDYLHRPDSPQGVTTWAFGEWSAEPVCAPGLVSLNGGPCVVPTRAQLAQRYAPKVWLAGGEEFMPSAVEDFLPNVHEEVHDGVPHYVTNQSLGCDDCTDPPFLKGRNPAQSAVPMYAEIVERTQNGQPTNVTDIIYWMFYPYNRGKSVCLGVYFDNFCSFYCPWPFDDSCCVPRFSGCGGDYKRFGNHVGDWEHVTIRFIDGVPSQVYLSQHDHGQVLSYGDPALQRSDDRIVVYSAAGSHGSYVDAARHTYESLPNGDSLNDDTSAGTLWDAANNLVTWSPQPAGSYTGSLSWLNYAGYWGNPESGCDVVGIDVGYCTLEGGPSSLMGRSVSNPAVMTLE